MTIPTLEKVNEKLTIAYNPNIKEMIVGINLINGAIAKDYFYNVETLRQYNEIKKKYL